MKLKAYPVQDDAIGTHVEVIFGYDPSHVFSGVIVRADAEPPYVMLFHIAEGRFVLAEECQWWPVGR